MRLRRHHCRSGYLQGQRPSGSGGGVSQSWLGRLPLSAL